VQAIKELEQGGLEGNVKVLKEDAWKRVKAIVSKQEDIGLDLDQFAHELQVRSGPGVSICKYGLTTDESIRDNFQSKRNQTFCLHFNSRFNLLNTF
jgi:hypothetical protein